MGLVLLIRALLVLIRTGRTSSSNARPSEDASSPTEIQIPQPPVQLLDASSIPKAFVVFDLETTGLDPERHEIIEIGAIRVHRDSEIHDTFQTLVKSTRRVPKAATRINGISQDMIDQDGEELRHVLQAFTEFIGDLPLVSFNADFDMRFLRKAADRHGFSIRNEVSCALKTARRAWPGRDSYRLCDLAKDGRIACEDNHRALGDCKRTLIIYAAAAAELGMTSAPTALR